MRRTVELKREGLPLVRRMDRRLASYNIEMAEVTGGTFWKEYTPAQVAGEEKVPPIKSLADLPAMMGVYPPIDLGDKNLRACAKALGEAWVRVSGSWATGTFYDLEDRTGGKAPEGYRAVLSRERWEGVLDFVEDTGAKLLVSVSNCPGDHPGGGPWNPGQARRLFDSSKRGGIPLVSAAEFMNEPNVMASTPPAPGYGAAEFGRDQDSFFRFVRKEHPTIKLVGPSVCADPVIERQRALLRFLRPIPTEDLIRSCREKPDVFSYHCYAGLSERGAALGGHWPESEALSDEYLGVAREAASYYARLRDRWCPGAPMWVTESADAGLGGNTWASSYLDVVRFVEELCAFAQISDGIVFHNTLASSDYGLLDRRTFEPRPNYWLLYVWKRLIGDAVYETGEEGHVWAFARKDGKPGYVYVVVNNSETEPLPVRGPKGLLVHRLHAGKLRSRQILLNGKILQRGADGKFPDLVPEASESGTVALGPAEVGFFTV